jgi:hypothetical protein
MRLNRYAGHERADSNAVPAIVRCGRPNSLLNCKRGEKISLFAADTRLARLDDGTATIETMIEITRIDQYRRRIGHPLLSFPPAGPTRRG